MLKRRQVRLKTLDQIRFQVCQELVLHRRECGGKVAQQVLREEIVLHLERFSSRLLPDELRRQNLDGKNIVGHRDEFALWMGIRGFCPGDVIIAEPLHCFGHSSFRIPGRDDDFEFLQRVVAWKHDFAHVHPEMSCEQGEHVTGER